MTILTEKYRFIRDDVFLCPQIDTETGKQKLIIQKIDLKTEKIEFRDSLDCIHTVINKISTEEYEQFQIDEDFQETIIDKSIQLRSGEGFSGLEISYLDHEEKFKAFKSWTAGIAETGIRVFEFQRELESLLPSIYPIFNFLMKFLVRIDTKFIYNYLFKIERECLFDNKWHKPSFIASLLPVLKWLDYEKNKITDDVVDAIIDLNPPFDLFSDFPSTSTSNILYHVLKNPNITKYLEFKTYFNNQDSLIRCSIAQNICATEFEEYNNFFNDEDYLVRSSVASNIKAVRFDEYKKLFNDEDLTVRRNVASNIKAARFDEYKKLFNDEDIRVSYTAFTNPYSKTFEEYFLILKNEEIQMKFAIHKNNWDHIKNFTISTIKRCVAISNSQNNEVPKELSLIFSAFKNINKNSNRGCIKEIIELILNSNIHIYLFNDAQYFLEYLFHNFPVRFNKFIKNILSKIESESLDIKKLQYSFFQVWEYVFYEVYDIYERFLYNLNNFDIIFRDIITNLLKIYLPYELILLNPDFLYLISKTHKISVIHFFKKLKSESLKPNYGKYSKIIASIDEKLLKIAKTRQALSQEYKFIIEASYN